MDLRKLVLLGVFTISVMACGDDKKEKDAVAEKERIAFEKTADSLARVNKAMDSINLEIKKTSDEIDALLNDINEDQN